MSNPNFADFVFVSYQDTLKAAPTEAVAMKKATTCGISVTTTFYMVVGILGYTAFGDLAPGNLLTGFGFFNPYWLVVIGNVFVFIHLIGAYQVSVTSAQINVYTVAYTILTGQRLYLGLPMCISLLRFQSYAAS